MTAPARPLRSRPDSPAAVGAQLARFLTVGVGNTALSFLVYAVLISAGIPYWTAGALGFAAGAVNGYVLNRRWTFGAVDSNAARARYLAVQLAGLGATSGLLWVFASGAGLDRLGAYAATVPAVTLATFAANRTWTFRPAVDPSSPFCVGTTSTSRLR